MNVRLLLLGVSFISLYAENNIEYTIYIGVGDTQYGFDTLYKKTNRDFKKIANSILKDLQEWTSSGAISSDTHKAIDAYLTEEINSFKPELINKMTILEIGNEFVEIRIYSMEMDTENNKILYTLELKNEFGRTWFGYDDKSFNNIVQTAFPYINGLPNREEKKIIFKILNSQAEAYIPGSMINCVYQYKPNPNYELYSTIEIKSRDITKIVTPVFDQSKVEKKTWYEIIKNKLRNLF